MSSAEDAANRSFVKLSMSENFSTTTMSASANCSMDKCVQPVGSVTAGALGMYCLITGQHFWRSHAARVWKLQVAACFGTQPILELSDSTACLLLLPSFSHGPVSLHLHHIAQRTSNTNSIEVSNKSNNNKKILLAFHYSLHLLSKKQ